MKRISTPWLSVGLKTLKLVFFCCMILILFLAFDRKGRQKSYSAENSEYSRSLNYPETEGIADSLPFHPFENECQLPIQSTYAQDVVDQEYSERIRTLKCEVTTYPMASMDDEGYIYIHNRYAIKPKDYLHGVFCNISIFEGGIRNATTGSGKNDFRIVATFAAPEARRLHVNADAFYVSCYSKNGSLYWEKPFAGMRDIDAEKNTVTVVPDTPSVDEFGRKIRRENIYDDSERPLSIDILGFDSTARTMFHRQMPRTWETMNRLGFEVLYGYNKVGDNSAINIVPILVGDVPETTNEPKFDSSGDINKNWILPTHRSIDPTNLRFLWKIMKEKFGCRSMLNDDISTQSLGLFLYPGNEFKAGFTENPADHYYRAYYLSVYKNWSYAPCQNGDQVQKEFLSLWHRFATKYSSICHFGFTFITTLTHETPMLLSLLDEEIADRLSSQHSRGVLENSVSVIMGDHGNRMGGIKYSYTGTFEERMPLMAFRFPESFKSNHPAAYRNFLENKFKLTSNFDIHQTLKDIVLNDFDDRHDSGRGISLFRKISSKRTCQEAFIPENFCTCLIHRSNLTMPMNGVEMKDSSHLHRKFHASMIAWINRKRLDFCILPTAPPYGNYSIIGQNPLVRHGLRSKQNASVTMETRSKKPLMNFLYHDIRINVTSQLLNNTIQLLWRFSNYIVEDEVHVNFEPLVENPP